MAAVLTPEQRAQYQKLAEMQNSGATLNAQQQKNLANLEGVRASGGNKSLLSSALAGVDYGAGGFAQKPAGGGGGGKGQAGGVAGQINAGRPIKNPGGLYDADVAGELDESAQQIKYGNPNYTGPTGGQKTYIDENGNVVNETFLSEDQQGILDRGEALTTSGLDMANSNLKAGEYGQPWDPKTADRTFQGNFGDDRLRVEDAVYNNLTRRFDRDQDRLVKDKEQELYNKGIAFSDDPNSRWQKEMGVIKESFNDRRDAAAAQATQFGGSEMANQFNMQETLIGNQFNQGLTKRQYGLSEVGALSGLGTGLMGPTEHGYNAPNYDVQDPSSYVYAKAGLKDKNQDQQLAEKSLQAEMALANKQLAQQMQIAQMNKPGGGSPTPPPFP
jgi:hypothetical protein